MVLGQLLDPGPGCREARSGSDRDPDLDAPPARDFGWARTPRWSRAVRCRRARTSRSSQLCRLAGVEVDEGIGRWRGPVDPGGPGVPLQGAEWPPTPGPPVRRRPGRSGRPGSASGLSQRGTQSGAWAGSALCQNPLVCGSVRKPMHVQGPAGQVGKRDGRDLGRVAHRSRLVTGCSPCGREKEPCRGWSPAAGDRNVPRYPTSSARPADRLLAGPGERCGFRAIGGPVGRAVRAPHPVGIGQDLVVGPSAQTERGWSSGFQPSTAYSSCLCSSSHCSLPESPSWSGPGRSGLAVCSPRRSRWSSPLADGRPGRVVAGPSGSQVPSSQTMTSPPPYSPAGSPPRSRSSPEGGPRRGRRPGGRSGRGLDPWAPPSSPGRRRSPSGSRSAGGGRDAAARRSGAPSVRPCAPPPGRAAPAGPPVRAKSRLLR